MAHVTGRRGRGNICGRWSGGPGRHVTRYAARAGDWAQGDVAEARPVVAGEADPPFPISPAIFSGAGGTRVRLGGEGARSAAGARDTWWACAARAVALAVEAWMGAF